VRILDASGGVVSTTARSGIGNNISVLFAVNALTGLLDWGPTVIHWSGTSTSATAENALRDIDFSSDGSFGVAVGYGCAAAAGEGSLTVGGFSITAASGTGDTCPGWTYTFNPNTGADIDFSYDGDMVHTNGQVVRQFNRAVARPNASGNIAVAGDGQRNNAGTITTTDEGGGSGYTLGIPTSFDFNSFVHLRDSVTDPTHTNIADAITGGGSNVGQSTLGVALNDSDEIFHATTLPAFMTYTRNRFPVALGAPDGGYVLTTNSILLEARNADGTRKWFSQVPYNITSTNAQDVQSRTVELSNDGSVLYVSSRARASTGAKTFTFPGPVLVSTLAAEDSFLHAWNTSDGS
jgi:hypothetical protein